MTRLAVFDCDGTLVDSQANICTAMESAFVEDGLPPPDRHAIRRIVGLSLPQAMAALLPHDVMARHLHLADRYKAHFQALRASGTMDAEPLFAGIGDVLAHLGATGWQMGVATGKSDRGLSLILAHHGITDHFVTLQTADRHPSKPHPAMLEAAMLEAGAAPGQTVVIGDTSYDMEMAVAAGARAIGVDWGYHDPHELIDAGAVAVARDAQELIALLESV